MPFLKKVAAKDKQGRPCTTKVGPGGSGHYVKMVHNGIEQGMMSIVCEVWSIMNRFLNMNYEEIANTFEEWVRSGPLSDNFLLAIAVDICRTKDEEGNYVLANVRDKVVQDVDETEGTGTWTCQEAVRLHVSAPTITAAHLFRLASADAARRIAVNKSFDGGFKGSLIQLESPHEKALPSFLEDLKQATHASFLLCFIQGLHIIEKASKEQNWNIDFPSLIQLWRGNLHFLPQQNSPLPLIIEQAAASSNQTPSPISSKLPTPPHPPTNTSWRLHTSPRPSNPSIRACATWCSSPWPPTPPSRPCRPLLSTSNIPRRPTCPPSSWRPNSTTSAVTCSTSRPPTPENRSREHITSSGSRPGAFLRIPRVRELGGGEGRVIQLMMGRGRSGLETTGIEKEIFRVFFVMPLPLADIL